MKNENKINLCAFDEINSAIDKIKFTYELFKENDNKDDKNISFSDSDSNFDNDENNKTSLSSKVSLNSSISNDASTKNIFSIEEDKDKKPLKENQSTNNIKKLVLNEEKDENKSVIRNNSSNNFTINKKIELFEPKEDKPIIPEKIKFPEINSDLDTQNGIIIRFLGNHNLVDSNGEAIKSLDKNKYYVISYQSDGTFLFLGGNQSYGIWEDNNPESPFYVESEIGRINISLYGNEYNNIISDELALQRAKYEIYKRCRLNDSLTLNTVPIYWADVNWKVSYTTFNNVTSEYMIQSMSIPLSVSGTQTIKLIKFYPLYPII